MAWFANTLLWDLLFQARSYRKTTQCQLHPMLLHTREICLSLQGSSQPRESGRWGSSQDQGGQNTVRQGSKANIARRTVTITRDCVCAKKDYFRMTSGSLWWYMSVSPAYKRLRQKDGCELKANLGHSISPCLPKR